MEPHGSMAPGSPGIPARWTSSAKSGVGTALAAESRVWFTISHGILNEVYYPSVDRACTRDFGLIISGPDGYFSEEKRHANHAIKAIADGVPAYHLVNSATDGSYRITKRILSDPARPSVLQEITFSPLIPSAEGYRVHALLSPHLVNAGMGNTAWIDEFRGIPILVAAGRGTCLAVASSLGWGPRTAGYVGFSDGWQQLCHQGMLDLACQQAEDGNVALTGQIPFSALEPTALLALSFGETPAAAAETALASLKSGFKAAEKSYVRGWRNWQDRLEPLDREAAARPNAYRVSTAVLATHRSRDIPGAAVASLSIPWGFNKGDDDLGGYHLVWPRDLVETAGGFLAAGDWEEALRILSYLRDIQQPDGHWPQNAWLDGRPYWNGIQMDECAFPMLLADMLRRQGHLPPPELKSFLPMILNAAGYVARNGPVTGEDRWEEDAGYSPFTLAVEISALLAAADIIEIAGKPAAAQYLRETADCWNDQIERWTYVDNTELSRAVGVTGYYVRITPSDTADAASPKNGFVPIKNKPAGDNANLPALQIVSPDALALVRFGLRAPDDPRILDTVKVIDRLLRCELPTGSFWYRYPDDGYGEHVDGSPFDGTGEGRPWPLLAGERAHYELAAGHRDEALRLLDGLEASAGEGRLIPEQVWDRGGPARTRVAARWTDRQRNALGLGALGTHQVATVTA